MKKLSSRILIIIAISILSCNNNKEEIAYYDNGAIKYKVRLNNGVREGLMMAYSKNGILDSKTTWSNGKLEGESCFYFKNGRIESRTIYKEGLLIDTSYLYFPNGNIRQIQIYNANEEVFKIERYDTNGIRLKTMSSRWISFLNKKDTIKFGDLFYAKIILSNQLHDSIKVCFSSLDNFNDKLIGDIYNKCDSKSFRDIATIVYKPEKKGDILVQGIVFDFLSEKPNISGIAEPIPFEFKLYVK